MDNLSGTANYFKTYEKRKSVKNKKDELPKEIITIKRSDINKMIKSFETLHEECERLYDIKTLKELGDIKANLHSMKRTIKSLTDKIENN